MQRRNKPKVFLTKAFMTFSGGIDMEHKINMG